MLFVKEEYEEQTFYRLLETDFFLTHKRRSDSSGMRALTKAGRQKRVSSELQGGRKSARGTDDIVFCFTL